MEDIPMKSFAKEGGDGPISPSQNSKGLVLEMAKDLTLKKIQQNIVPPSYPNPKTHPVLRIADLGCSVGPNTFACIQTIIEAIRLKHEAEGVNDEVPEIQVFFNDQESNDFNTLFRSLPQDHTYLVAGVPGSFYGNLFPRTSMNIIHSSFALQWLSKVPEDVLKPDSPAWNKRKISYRESAPEVAEAFRTQFNRDLGNFFELRSAELVDNGLIVILMPCRPDDTEPAESLLMDFIEFLSHVLVDMVEEGLFDRAVLDSFNLPVFIPTVAEVVQVASKIDVLSIEVVEKINFPRNLSLLNQQPSRLSSNIQARVEDLLIKHWGLATTELIFSRLPKKIEQKLSERPPPMCLENIEKFENLFMLLRKRASSN